MKKIIVVLVIFALYSCNNSNNNQLWLNDFELLKSAMINGYANLQYASKKEGIDLVELNNTTLGKLKDAQNKEDAQKIIKEFLHTFKDGHLRARKLVVNNKKSNKQTNNESVPLSNSDTGIDALKKMGYENREEKLNIKYDSVPGIYSLNLKNNPFTASIIDGQNHKIGILRIGFFGYWRFWNTALSVWESHKKTFSGPCDGGCEWTFTKKVEKELTKKLITSIDTLKAENIDALVVDVSGNGGGTEWYEAVARLFSDKELKDAPFYFVKHKIWRQVLQRHLNLINQDLDNTKLSTSLIEKLLKFKDLTESLLAKCENNCDSNTIWNEREVNCLELIEHPYSQNLPFNLMEDHQFNDLQSKNIVATLRFLPFKRGVFSDANKLFIIQDSGSGSATEGFSSILQSNNAAVIVGENSYGAGCGYTNGGQNIKLENIGLSVKMPDCVRLRKDGKNEIYGIKPDISVPWDNKDSEYDKGLKVINSIQAYLKDK